MTRKPDPRAPVHRTTDPWFLAALLAVTSLINVTHATDLSLPGPFVAGTSSVQVPRASGGSFTANLYYPALNSGPGGTFNPAGGPYPVMSFGHGFLSPVGLYETTLTHLASWGYFVIAPTTQSGLFPSHAAFATELRESLTFVVSENARVGSPFFGGVATDRLGLSGHSMGGGASLLAAAADPRVRAVANLAAAETAPSAVAAMPSIQAPVSLISGSNDTITPLANHGLRMFNNGRAPIQLPVLDGVTHTGFTDLAGDDQRAKSRQALTAFFNLYLKNDESLWRNVWGPDPPAFLTSASRFEPGIDLATSSPATVGLPGRWVQRQVRVTNTGQTSNVFDLIAEDALWPLRLSASETPILGPGESFDLLVEVRIPKLPPSDATDSLLLSARSRNDGLTRDFIELTTTYQDWPAGQSTLLPIETISATPIPEPTLSPGWGYLLAPLGAWSWTHRRPLASQR